MLEIQTNLLKFFGILPLTQTKKKPHKKFLAFLSGVICFCLMTGTLYSTGINGANAFYGFFHPDSADESMFKLKNSTILLVLQLMPFFTINSRAFLTLFLLLLRRKQWVNLMDETKQLFDCYLPSTCSPILLRSRLRGASVCLFFVTFVMHAIWEAVEWPVYFDGLSNSSMMADNFVAPIPLKYYAFQGVIIWSLFSTLPFILSQQIFAANLVLVMIVNESLKAINGEIEEERQFYSGKFGYLREKDVNLSEERLNRWEVCHLQLLVFCESLNDFFGRILLMIYGLDLLAVLGFASNIVYNSRADLESYAYLVLSGLFFLSYATIFFIPFVAVHEQGNSIKLKALILAKCFGLFFLATHHLKFHLHRLAYRLDQRLLLLMKQQQTWISQNQDRPVILSGNRLLKRLRQFETVSHRYTCELTCAKIIHFSRTFLVGTCSFMVSFMVLAREFFVKEQVHDFIHSTLNT